MFLKARAKKQVTAGKHVSDPYRDTWSAKTTREMFEEVQASLHYERIYRPLSDWHHWSTPGLASAMAMSEDGYTFSTRSPRHTALCRSAAFLCLWQTMGITNEAARLRRAEALAEVRDGYMKELGAITPGAMGDEGS